VGRKLCAEKKRRYIKRGLAFFWDQQQGKAGCAHKTGIEQVVEDKRQEGSSSVRIKKNFSFAQKESHQIPWVEGGKKRISSMISIRENKGGGQRPHVGHDHPLRGGGGGRDHKERKGCQRQMRKGKGGENGSSIAKGFSLRFTFLLGKRNWRKEVGDQSFEKKLVKKSTATIFQRRGKGGKQGDEGEGPKGEVGIYPRGKKGFSGDS